MKTTIPETQLKQWAKFIFAREHRSFESIAEETGVDPAQLRLWAHQENWAGYRTNDNATTDRVRDLVVGIIGKTADKIANAPETENTAKDLDLLMKYMASLKNLETEPSFQSIVAVAKTFTTWLRRKDKTFSDRVIDEFDDFIQERMKMYNA